MQGYFPLFLFVDILPNLFFCKRSHFHFKQISKLQFEIKNARSTDAYNC